MTLVVVGANVAGVSAAEAARKIGYTGRVVVIGRETHLPYDRPPLSKQIITGEWGHDRIALRPSTSYETAGIEMRLGHAATRLDLDAREVVVDTGERLGFDHIVIATGVRPAVLPFASGLTNVQVLRTLDDAVTLRAALLGGGPLIVIGAGFLGTEVAAAARTTGIEVTVIDSLAEPLSRALGDWVGGRIRALHERNGVRFRLGVGVADFVSTNSTATGVRLTDGSIEPAAHVLVAIGAIPNVDWLDGSGLATDAGVQCDQYCLAAPDVAAAGDVASWHHPTVGRPMRIEHRMNAQEHGAAAVRNLLAEPVPFAPVPYFWSDQYDVKIQAYGVLAADADLSLASGDPDTGKFTLTYRQRGRLVGALGWNSPRETRAYRAVVEAGSSDIGAERPLTTV